MWLVNLWLRVCWLEFVKIWIFIAVDIFKHTAKKNEKNKRADQILPEVYGTTLSGRSGEIVNNLSSVLSNLGERGSGPVVGRQLRRVKDEFLQ